MRVLMISIVWLPFLLFSGAYLRRRWWRNPAGVSTFVMAAVVNVVLFLVWMRYLGVPLPQHAREGIYSLIGVAGYVQLGVYVHAQRHPTPTPQRRCTDERTDAAEAADA